MAYTGCLYGLLAYFPNPPDPPSSVELPARPNQVLRSLLLAQMSVLMQCRGRCQRLETQEEQPFIVPKTEDVQLFSILQAYPRPLDP